MSRNCLLIPAVPKLLHYSALSLGNHLRAQQCKYYISEIVLGCFFLSAVERISRYRPKGVFGKGVGNSQNASEMRQKCVKNASETRQNGSCFIGKRGTPKMRQKSVKIKSKMRQKCAEHLWGRTPFGRYRISIWRRNVLFTAQKWKQINFISVSGQMELVC